MKRGRIVLLFAGLFLLGASRSIPRDIWCEGHEDQIVATASADTIFVGHAYAERNCCTDLVLRVELEGFTVDFFEGDAGEYCACICCFFLRYEAHGFAAGHYTVRVWNDDGSILYGEAGVDVPGPGGAPVLGWMERGECGETGGIEGEPPDSAPVTWGVLRTAYR